MLVESVELSVRCQLSVVRQAEENNTRVEMEVFYPFWTNSPDPYDLPT